MNLLSTHGRYNGLTCDDLVDRYRLPRTRYYCQVPPDLAIASTVSKGHTVHTFFLQSNRPQAKSPSPHHTSWISSSRNSISYNPSLIPPIAHLPTPRGSFVAASPITFSHSFRAPAAPEPVAFATRQQSFLLSDHTTAPQLPPHDLKHAINVRPPPPARRPILHERLQALPAGSLTQQVLVGRDCRREQAINHQQPMRCLRGEGLMLGRCRACAMRGGIGGSWSAFSAVRDGGSGIQVAVMD
jgi:hypothetical protein